MCTAQKNYGPIRGYHIDLFAYSLFHLAETHRADIPDGIKSDSCVQTQCSQWSDSILLKRLESYILLRLKSLITSIKAEP